MLNFINKNKHFVGNDNNNKRNPVTLDYYELLSQRI